MATNAVVLRGRAHQTDTRPAPAAAQHPLLARIAALLDLVFSAVEVATRVENAPVERGAAIARAWAAKL